jgi:hypothetical protein
MRVLGKHSEQLRDRSLFMVGGGTEEKCFLDKNVADPTIKK